MNDYLEEVLNDNQLSDEQEGMRMSESALVNGHERVISLEDDENGYLDEEQM